MWSPAPNFIQEQQMFIKQNTQGIVLLGKSNDVIQLMRDAIAAGYGNLSAVWCIKLYLVRN